MAQFEIFKKVPVSEKKIILQGLEEKKLPMLMKGSRDEIYQMTVEFVVDEKSLVLSCKADPKPPQKNDEVFVNFEYKEDRFFFRGFLRPDSVDGYIISIDESIYSLQRRKTARVEFPEGYPALFHVNNINDGKASLEAQILDYSSGGIRIKIAKEGFVPSVDDVYRGSLYLGKRAPFEVQVVVRHLRPPEDKTGMIVGCQFHPLDRVLESKLMTIYMDIQRELFTKQTKKMI